MKRLPVCMFPHCLLYILQDGATPVYLAAEKGHVEAVKYLVSVGVDKSRPDMVGWWRGRAHPGCVAVEYSGGGGDCES